MFRALVPGFCWRICFIFMTLSGGVVLPAAAWDLPASPSAGTRFDDSFLRSSGEADKRPYEIGRLQELKVQITRQRETGNHAAALKSIDKALHLLRVDGGPDNPAQLPLLEIRLDSLQALGRLQEIDQQYQGMLHLYRSHFGPGDVRTASLLGRIARWQMGVFYQQLQGTGEGAGAVMEPGQRAQAFTMLEQSQLNLIDAVTLHVKAGNWPSRELQGLEERLLESYYLFAWREALENDPDHYLLNRSPRRESIYRRVNMDAPRFVQAFQQGELVLNRLLTYQQQAVNRDAVEEGKVLLAIADWHLLFGHNKEALSLYRDAEQWLAARGYDFSRDPDLLQPVLLPTFSHSAVQPFSTEFEEESDYIDVSFSVTRYGRASNIEITGYSRLQDDEVQKRLLGWLRQGQFRPRFAGNEIDESELSLRYYYQ